MKLLRLTVVTALFGCVVVLSASAQTTQPAQDQGSAAAQTAPAPGATDPYMIFPAKPPRFQLPAGKPFQNFRQLRRQLKPTPPQGDFDRGIYAMHLAPTGEEMCGSIMSYNFSEGEHPQLESVTTCTSASTVKSLRARGKDKKPVAPLFKTTDLKVVSPQ
jgi:hypothetical protein